MTMREKIAKGMLFTDMCEGLTEERLMGKELMYEFNHLRPSEEEKRLQLIKKMLGKTGTASWGRNGKGMIKLERKLQNCL